VLRSLTGERSRAERLEIEARASSRGSRWRRVLRGAAILGCIATAEAPRLLSHRRHVEPRALEVSN